jgi:hypothetical protein
VSVGWDRRTDTKKYTFFERDWTQSVQSVLTIPRAGPHGVPSPIHASKSRSGGEVPTFEPQETMIKIGFIIMKSNLD